MSNSDNLLALIKNMGKAEKRSFRLYSNRYSGKNNNNYSLLFDQLCRQETDDNKSGQLKIRSGSSLSMQRSYLYSLLLDSLVDQEKLRTREKMLMHELNRAEILIRKELFSQAQKIIQPVKLQAVNEEKFCVAIKAVSLLIDIAKSESYQNTTVDELQNLFSEHALLNNFKSNFHELDRIATTMHLLVLKHGSRNKVNDIFFERCAASPYLADENLALSKQALLRFYYCKLTYFANKTECADFNKSIEYARKALSLVLSHPKIFDDPYWEIFYRHQYLIQLLMVRDYDKIHEEINNFHKSVIMQMELPRKLRAELLKAFVAVPLEVFIQKREYEPAIKHITETANYFKEISEIVDPARLIYYYSTFARVYFWAGRYKEALVWVNKVINETSDDFRPDLKCMMKLMQVIIHCELNNHEILEHLILSTYRFLKKREMLLDFERAVLEMMKKVLTVKSASEQASIYKEYYHKFKTITSNPAGKHVPVLFDVTRWLEKRIA